jgi:hypothetical protein
LYSPDTEELFLNYGSFLLLEATKKSPDFSAKLFEEGLPNATFQGQHDIDGSWTGKHSIMNPLFAPSQSMDFVSVPSAHFFRYCPQRLGRRPHLTDIILRHKIAFQQSRTSRSTITFGLRKRPSLLLRWKVMIMPATYDFDLLHLKFMFIFSVG